MSKMSQKTGSTPGDSKMEKEKDQTPSANPIERVESAPVEELEEPEETPAVEESVVAEETIDAQGTIEATLDVQTPKPWYGETRYDIVDEVLDQLHAKEQLNNINPVQLASLRAQEPYKTVSMKDLGQSYKGPPKYLQQRDAPLDIPAEIIRKLFFLIDQDMDDKISYHELQNYVTEKGVPIADEIVQEMYHEACSHRSIVHEAQRNLPLSFEEIQYQVRGRYGFNANKEWDVVYKPMRDYWIILLLTVSERLFALQVPKVVPQKIKAQYEDQEALAQMQESLNQGEITYRAPEGIDRKYLSVQEVKQTEFQIDKNKVEGGIKLQDNGHWSLQPLKQDKAADQQPYDKTTNQKIEKEQNSYPKVTFESKEIYSQAYHLCQQIPHWNKDSDNPIFQYVPTSERPYKNTADEFFTMQQNQGSLREQRLLKLSNKGNRSLILAGTMSLNARQKSPQTKIRERNGFVTAAMVPDVFNDKTRLAESNMNEFDPQTRLMKPKVDEYVVPKPHQFRKDVELDFGQKDMSLPPMIKPNPIDNPHALSVFAQRPKFITDKEKIQHEKEVDDAKFMAAGKPHDFIKYNKLPDKLIPIADQFEELHGKWPLSKKEQSAFLNKDRWCPAYLELARTMKDDFVYGKPKLDLYYRGVKPEHRNLEIGEKFQPTNLIQ